MSTVILKWNPSFSSYSMFRFLAGIVDLNYGEMENYNWSVWDYDKIHKGDRFYWLKVGYGQVGIVGAGTIISEPYEDEDWRGKGRRTFYVDFIPEILINSDALPILSAETLSDYIPDFEWDRGHSGLVLNPQQSAALDELWNAYIEEHRSEFIRKAVRYERENDLIFWEEAPLTNQVDKLFIN